MDVRVLGPVEVYNGHRLAIGGPRQRRILAALAMHAGEIVSTDRLAQVTWSDVGPGDQSEANLRSYVYRVRSGLGEDLGDRIVTRPPGYVLRIDPDELDSRRFERLVLQADRVAAKGDPASAVAYINEALAQWHGEPYQEFAGEDWVEAETARLIELKARARERRADSLIQLDRADDAVAELESLIEDHPYRERPRRLLMVALYATGRQAEALRSFHEFRELLVDEMGLDPSDELADLEQQMLQQDPALLAARDRGRSVRSYELDEVIGEGAFALVWRGTQPDLDREVAIKQIRDSLANDPDFIRRFEVEAQLVSSLEHPYIVPLYDYWREPDAAFLVMRLLRGGTLMDRIAAGPLDDTELQRLVDQIGSALRLAHRAGVIHRDVKPANVVLDEEGNFYLTDFGIAFGIDGEDDAAAALSTGSRPYAAPEQLRREHLDPRTDIYSFGVTVYEAAVGSPPFAAEQTEAESLRLQLEGAFQVPSLAAPGVPAWVDTVVARSTALSPDDRYHEITDLMADASSGLAEVAGPEIAKPRISVDRERNPFKGLRSFHEADAGDFHGRQRLVERFLDVLSRPGSAGRLVAAVGPSGSGKSSVVRAGLVPALRRGARPGSDRWFIATMRPGSRPFEELASALTTVAPAPPGSLLGPMLKQERGLGEALRRMLPDESAQLLLVIDQFEEVFTLVESDQDRRRFLDGLVAAVREPRSRLRVVLTVRADFWDRPLMYPKLAGLLEEAAVTVSPLAADELEQAIVGPVEDHGIAYEPGLVARITADVADQPGALPLLQFALTELFERADGRQINASAYDDIGGIAGALAQRAEDIYNDQDDLGRAASRRVIGRLVTLGEGIEDTRRRVTISELGAAPETADVLASFGEARLLTFDRDPATRLPTVEIAHEALLRAWPRVRQWIDDDRDALRAHRQLTIAARGWDHDGRDDDELYRGARLETAAALAQSRPDALNEVENAFVHASVASARSSESRSRRRTRVLQGLLSAAGVLLIVAVVATFIAIDRADDAATERDAAIAAEVEAEDALAELRAELLRTTVGGLALDGPPVVATLLAVELHSLDPGPQSLDLLARNLLVHPGWLGSIAADWLEVSEARGWLITDEASEVVVRDRADLSILRRIPIEPFPEDGPGPRFNPQVSPDGGRIVVDQPDGVHIVSLDTGEFGPAMAADLMDAPKGLAWSSDGSAVIGISEQSELVVLGAAGLELTPSFTVELDLEPRLPYLLPHPTDDVMAVSSNGTVLLLDTSALATGVLPVLERIGLGDSGLSTASWSADGHLYVPVLFQDKTFEISRSQGVSSSGSTWAAHEVDVLSGAGALWVSTLGDGTLFVSTLDGQAQVIDATTGAEIDGPWPSGEGGYIQPIEVMGGEALAMVESDGVRRRVQVWSRVGGNAFGRTLPAFGPNMDAQPLEGAALFLSEASVIKEGGFRTDVWNIGVSPATPVDFGIPDPRHVSLASTDKGPMAVVVDGEGLATLHDLPSGTLAAGPVDVGSISEAALSSNGEQIVVTDQAGLRVLDVGTGQDLGTFRFSEPPSIVLGLEVQHGLAAVTGVESMQRVGTTMVVDLETLEVVYRGDGFASGFSPDRDAFFTTTDEGFALVEIASGDVRWSIPDQEVFGAWDSNGHVAFTFFGALQFRDPSGGQPIGPRVEGDAPISPDGSLVHVRDGRAHLWETDTSQWPTLACEAAGRNLTREEWATYLPEGLAYGPSCPQWPIDP